MGSVNITHATTDASETLEAAFARLADEAAYEDGHSYSGGFNMCYGGVRLASDKIMTLAEAEAFAEKRFDSGAVRKWGNAEGVALATEVQARYANVRTLDTKPIHLSGDAMKRVVEDSEALRPILARELGVKASEIISWRSQNYTPLPIRVSKWTARTHATSGKAVTRYFIITSDNAFMPAWESGFATQAQARAELATRLDNTGKLPAGKLEPRGASIIAMTRRESGEALAGGTATPKEVEVAAMSVQVGKIAAKAKVDRTKRSGWFIYGDAAE